MLRFARARPVVWGSLLLLVAVGACGSSSGEEAGVPLEEGDEWPLPVVSEPGEEPDGQLELHWFFDREDFLKCTMPLRELRHLTRAGGRRPVVHAHGVGLDTTYLIGFLQRERIQAVPHTLFRSRFERRFGSMSLPFLALVRSGRIQRIWPARGKAGTGRAIRGFRAESVLAGQPPDSR